MDLKEVLKILIEKLQAQNIDFVLIGGLALSTMNIFRFTKDLDFMVHENSKEKINAVMAGLGYAKQDFSNFSSCTANIWTWDLSGSISNFLKRKIFWMNGSRTLSDEEKQEMLADAGSVSRKKAFLKARASSQSCSLDDYIEFLSKSMASVPNHPTKHITEDFRL